MESLRQEANSPQQPAADSARLEMGGEDFLDWILDKMPVPTKEAQPWRKNSRN